LLVYPASNLMLTILSLAASACKTNVTDHLCLRSRVSVTCVQRGVDDRRSVVSRDDEQSDILPPSWRVGSRGRENTTDLASMG
jgi:hypothetical protein